MIEMTTIEAVRPEGGDTKTAYHFYTDALELGEHVHPAAAETPTSGFRGFTLSLVVPQPATVDAFIEAAMDAGGKLIAPASKSLWGYGGAVEAPDGTIVTVAVSKKKNSGPPLNRSTRSKHFGKPDRHHHPSHETGIAGTCR